MGTRAVKQVNFVDAIAQIAERIARNRTANLRTGKVVSVTGSIAVVQVGIAATVTVRAGWHKPNKPVAGDLVNLLNDGDRWVILGVQGT